MYIKNNKNFKEGLIWWDTEPRINEDIDVFFYIHDYKGRAEYKYKFKTLVWNLREMTYDDIFRDYSPTLRNTINNSLKVDFKFEIKIMEDSDVLDYVSNFNSFANFKNLNTITKEFVISMVRDKKIYISKIYFNDKLLFCHSYYTDGETARLFHSFSVINNVDKKINGMANKFLTDRDILYFKNNNFRIYDIGGIGNLEGDNSKFLGIIKFKKSFGGKEKIIWKGVSPNGSRGNEIIRKYFNINKH